MCDRCSLSLSSSRLRSHIIPPVSQSSNRLHILQRILLNVCPNPADNGRNLSGMITAVASHALNSFESELNSMISASQNPRSAGAVSQTPQPSQAVLTLNAGFRLPWFRPARGLVFKTVQMLFHRLQLFCCCTCSVSFDFTCVGHLHRIVNDVLLISSCFQTPPHQQLVFQTSALLEPDTFRIALHARASCAPELNDPPA